jgi:ferrochelatase
MMAAGAYPGALLMTYGSPATLEREDIASYLGRVRGGREPSDELVDEFVRRYRLIGGSPLIPATRAQAAALEDAIGWPVEVGMRFSEPSIETGLRALSARGVTEVAAITLSPQHSALLMGGYAAAIQTAREQIGTRAPAVEVADAWHLEPSFVSALAGSIRSALDDIDDAVTLLTAHSIPRQVADREPGYLAQLRETADAVAAEAELGDAWRFCWQSAGHEPGEWMTPDFADLLPELAAAGNRRVLVAPVQFLSAHLEVLYDIDVAAREQAEACGLEFHRAATLDTDPRFIAGLASVAHRSLHNPG